MKKTFNATKKIEYLGIHQVISTYDTLKCTTATMVFFNGKIYKTETYYYEHPKKSEEDWNDNLKYYTNNKYKIVTL